MTVRQTSCPIAKGFVESGECRVGITRSIAPRDLRSLVVQNSRIGEVCCKPNGKARKNQWNDGIDRIPAAVNERKLRKLRSYVFNLNNRVCLAGSPPIECRASTGMSTTGGPSSRTEISDVTLRFKNSIQVKVPKQIDRCVIVVTAVAAESYLIDVAIHVAGPGVVHHRLRSSST